MSKHYTYLAFSLTIATPQVTQSAQPDAGQILNELQQAQPRLMEQLPQRESVPERLGVPEPGTAKVLIKKIRFTSAENVATETELEAQVVEAIGKEFNYAGLQQLAERVTHFLKDKGYLLAKAYLPAQDLTEGVLEMAIQVSRVEGSRQGEGIDIQAGSVRLDKNIIRGVIARSVFRDEETAPIKTENLERGLLLLSDMPGIAAKASLERGNQAGTSKLVVLADEGPLLTGHVGEDNFGSRYTGTWRTNLGANLNDPFGKGDQITANFTHATDLNLAAVNYWLPLGTDGWFVDTNFSNLDYQIGQELSVLDNKGSVRTTGFNIGYPFYRTRRFNLWGGLGYTFKWLEDESLNVVVHNKQINAATVSLNGTYRDNYWLAATTNFRHPDLCYKQ